MNRMIFVNLPVADLAASTRFYEALGCKRNPSFSDDKASSMMWSDTIVIHLLRRDYFATFTPKPVADAHRTSEMLLALSVDSRTGVDAVADRAAGGRADPRPLQDHGFMYSRAIDDRDGLRSNWYGWI